MNEQFERRQIILSEIPQELKDVALNPKRFKEIEKKINTPLLKITHQHKGKMCKQCQKIVVMNLKHRIEIREKLGFKTAEHYFQWKDICLKIINKEKIRIG